MKFFAVVFCCLTLWAALATSAVARAGSENLFSCPPALQTSDQQNPSTPITCAVTLDAQIIRNGDQLKSGTMVRCPLNTYICIPEGCLLQYNFVAEPAESTIRHNCPKMHPACLCENVCGTCPGTWRPE